MVGRGTSNRDTCTWFTLRMESNDIRVHRGGNDVTYTVRPDDTGDCKLWRGGESFDLWQVLKKALELLLFGTTR